MSELLRAEVAVIGSGAAGVMAAVAAARADAAVVLIDGPPGATALCSGAIDLAGEQCRGAAMSVSESLARSLAASPAQPLSAFDQVVVSRLADSVVREICGLSELYPQRGIDRLQAFVPTSLGGLHPCWLRQLTQADLRTMTGWHLGVVDVPGDTSPAALICHELTAEASAAGIEASFSTVPLSLPGSLVMPPLLLARRLDEDESAVRAVGSALTAAAAASAPIDVLLVPPWLGIDQAHAVLAALEEMADVVIRELLGRPGDPPGVRLHRLLGRAARERGVERLQGKAVETLTTEREVNGIRVRGAHVDVTVEAHSFILATGGLSGGGFALKHMLEETLFGLPLEIDGRLLEPPASRCGTDPSELFGPDLSSDHPICRAGVPHDSSLRPQRQGRPIFENLRVAGAMMAGNDLLEVRSGLGTAMLTGWFAGETAAAEITPSSS